jgi:predicted RNA-binding Zn-ribbon protein involved in translation (DUF1610 family)
MTSQIPPRFIVSSEELIGEWDWNKVERCIVCNLAMRKEDPIAHCPACGHPAHRDHLLEWIKIKGVCPFCKRKITADKI